MQKGIVFKLFHPGKRFQKVPFSWIFLCGYKRISVDGRRIRNNKVPFSNLSVIVKTGPKLLLKVDLVLFLHEAGISFHNFAP